MSSSEQDATVADLQVVDEKEAEEAIASELAATSIAEHEKKVDEMDEKRQQVALAALASFRSRVRCQIGRPEAVEFATDDTLLRYLRARDGNEEKALSMFLSTLAWRAKNINPVAAASSGDEAPYGTCEQCKTDPRSHCFFNVGNDALGRPVVYSCAARAANKVVEDNMIHMALELERLFEGNKAPGKYVWVIDFKGMGMRDANPRMATTAIPMFTDHYPERMGQIVLINPPAIFHMFWKACKPILDNVTKEKIVMLRGAKDIAQYAAEHWQKNAAMAAWLDETMTNCKGAPGSFPDARLSDSLSDERTRQMLEKCRQLK